MNRNRAYVNRFVKIKEQEIEDSYHSINLRDMKPVTSKHMTHHDTILINNTKREMIREVREIEVQRENKVLLQKISSVMAKKGAYSVNKPKNIRSKVNKSLNQFYRKRQMEDIEIENKRFVSRLQQKKPTLNMEKINKDWVHNKSLSKRMANCQFNLTSIKSTNHVYSSTSQKFYKTKYENAKVSKFRVIDGHKMLIKIEFMSEILKITGDCQDSKDLKVIEIPRDEAIVFIEKDCHGKVENVIDRLKYDAKNGTLFLVSQYLDEEEQSFSEFNPEMEQSPAIHKREVRSLKQNKNTPSVEVSTKRSSQAVKTKEPEQKYTKKQVEEPQNKTISVIEEKNENSQKDSEKKIEPQQSLIQEQPVEKITPAEESNPEPEHVKTDNAKVVQEEHVVEGKEKVIEPQQDKYEEERFEESANLAENNQKNQPKVENQIKSVEESPVVEKEEKEINNLAETQKQVEEEAKQEVIVAPVEVEDYKEQFEENKEEVQVNEAPTITKEEVPVQPQVE